jgi:hypothetical protein
MGANVEQGFITQLLINRDIKEANDKEISPKFFSGKYKQAFKYIAEHCLKYGKVPSMGAFKRRFPSFEFATLEDGTVGTEEDMNYWCDELRQKKKHNTIADATEDILEKVNELDTDGAFKVMKNTVLKVENEIILADRVYINKNTQKRKEDYLKRQRSGGMTGIPTYIQEYDLITGGMNKEELTGTMGFTGIGKTWEILIKAVNQAKHGYRIFVGTTEMSTDMMMRRVDALWCGLNYTKFRKGQLEPDQQKRYFKYLDEDAPKLGDILIVEHVDDVVQFSSKVDEYKPDVAYIDGAYIMQNEDDEDDWKSVRNVVRGLHQICLNKHIPVEFTTQSKEEVGNNLKTIAFSKAVAQECLAPNTLILTDRGVYPIKELEGKSFRVFDGINYKKAICVDAGEKSSIKINYSGKSLISSKNHLFVVYDNKKGAYALKYAKHLTNNDYLIEYDEEGYSRGKGNFYTPEVTRGRSILTPVDADEDLGTFIGYMLGDGCIRPFEKGQVVLSCGQDLEYAENAIRIVLRHFGIRGKIVKAPSKCDYQYRVEWYSRAFSDILKYYIESEQGKYFNFKLYSYNSRFRMGLIAGLVQSDGDTSCGLRYVSKQYSLSLALKNLLALTGVYSYIKEYGNYYRLYARHSDMYKLRKLNLIGNKRKTLLLGIQNSKIQGGFDIPSKYALYQANKVVTKGLPKSLQSSIYQAKKRPTTCIELLRKMEKLNNINNKYSFKFIKIDNIEQGNKMKMYDVSIQDSNKLFLAENILTHNCDIFQVLEQDEQMHNDMEIALKFLKLREGKLGGRIYSNWDFDKMNYAPIYKEKGAEESDRRKVKGVITID